MFAFRKKSKQLSYGYENPFQNMKNWANFTNFLKFIRKNRNNCILVYYFFSAYFLKKCQKLLQRTSVGEYFEKTSVGRNTGRITSKKSKLGHIVLVDRFFFRIFFSNTWESFRKDVGGCKSHKDVGR